MATRFQLRRAAGWRKPSGGVVVARPSKWGNPYPVAEYGRTRAVQLYHAHLAEHPDLADTARHELTGRDLGCWCPLDAPCHADVLLYLANAEPVTCPDCDGTGEITESVRVGGRRNRPTDDRQSAVCLTCWGIGHNPEAR
jgi:hypothetical protein